MTHDFLPARAPVKILLTSGASCPDAVVEEVIEKLISLFSAKISVEQMIENFV